MGGVSPAGPGRAGTGTPTASAPWWFTRWRSRRAAGRRAAPTAGDGTMLVQRTPEEERSLLHADSNGYTNLPDVVQPGHSPTEPKGQGGSPAKDSASDYQSRGLVKAPGKSSFTMFVDLGIYQTTGSGDTIPITALVGADPRQLEQLQLEVRKGSVVNVNPTNTRPHSDTPEIRKYKKRFNSEILCAALWGVNLLVGTENGLLLLDRSGQGKVYGLISRRRFQQMAVLEGLNLLTTISGKRNKLRVYYLSWLRNKILHNDPEVEKKQGWTTVGDMEGCVHYRVVKYERIKFLVIALKNSVEVYAWAPKPYHKFMAFKSFADLPHRPLLVELTVEEGQRLKVIYGSCAGFHAIDVDSGNNYDIYIPVHVRGRGDGGGARGDAHASGRWGGLGRARTHTALGGSGHGAGGCPLPPDLCPVPADPDPHHTPRHHLPAQHGGHGDAALLRGRGRLRQHLRAHHQGRGAAVGGDAHLRGVHLLQPDHGLGREGHRDPLRGDGAPGRGFHAQAGPAPQVPVRAQRQGFLRLRPLRGQQPGLLHDTQQKLYHELVKGPAPGAGSAPALAPPLEGRGGAPSDTGSLCRRLRPHSQRGSGPTNEQN
ncbi:unnamed protein product [Lepidochelys kempii]